MTHFSGRVGLLSNKTKSVRAWLVLCSARYRSRGKLGVIVVK
jgi:hypothetical protein